MQTQNLDKSYFFNVNSKKPLMLSSQNQNNLLKHCIPCKIIKRVVVNPYKKEKLKNITNVGKPVTKNTNKKPKNPDDKKTGNKKTQLM